MSRHGLYVIGTVGQGTLSIVARPRGGDWLDDEIARLAAQGVQLLVSLLMPDEQQELGLLAAGECCRTAGIDFLSIPVQDLGVPEDEAAFDATIASVIDRLYQGHSVAVHCRQSVGRSGLFACAVLVASGVPQTTAIATVSAARGVPVPETPEQRRWLERYGKASGARRASNDSSR